MKTKGELKKRKFAHAWTPTGVYSRSGPPFWLVTIKDTLEKTVAKGGATGSHRTQNSFGRDEIPASMTLRFLLAILTLHPAPDIRESRVPSRRL
jgi:hypothetical protein